MQDKHQDRNHLTSRPATLDDADSLAQLLNRRSQAYYGQNQVHADDLTRYWTGDEIELGRDTQLFFDAAGNLAGYACVLAPRDPYIETTYQMATGIDLDDEAEMWDALITWCAQKDDILLDLAPEGVAVYAKASALAEDKIRQTAYERNGLKPVRVESHMRAELDSLPPEPDWPAGITLPAFDIEAELPALVELDQEVFRDHWGHVERSFEEELRGWKEWIRSSGENIDPSLWFVARKGHELVGYAICEPSMAGDKTRAYVGGLGVSAAYRKQGIGLALLRHAFRELANRGFAAVELDMDSENLTGASRVYERAGLVPTRQMILYEKLLREGNDITVRSLD